METTFGDNPGVGKPRRKYGSLESARDALKNAYHLAKRKHLEPSDPPPVVYHYCSAEAMKSILSSGKLYACDALRMEDDSELVYALDVARPITKEEENGSPRYFIGPIKAPDEVRQVLGKYTTYIACLSACPHIPSQWEKCADHGRGCAIGFEREETFNLCRHLGVAGPFPMLYDRSTQEQMVKGFLERGTQLRDKRGLKEPVLTEVRNRGLVHLMSLLMAVKNPDFVAEREWRGLVIEDDDPLSFEHGCIGTNRPLVKLPICTPQTVVEVVLGSQSNLTIDAVQSFMVGANFSNTRVRRSDVPTAPAPGNSSTPA